MPALIENNLMPISISSFSLCWATSCEELTHWKRLSCWEGLGAGGEGDDRGWDDWMASLTRWTWVWVNSGRWWWTGRPGVLRFMGSQRVRHDWATELNWTELNILFWASLMVQMGKKSVCSARDLGWIPGLGRFPGEGDGYPLQYSCLQNSMDKGDWWAIVHGVTKSWTQLSNQHSRSIIIPSVSNIHVVDSLDNLVWYFFDFLNSNGLQIYFISSIYMDSICRNCFTSEISNSKVLFLTTASSLTLSLNVTIF